MDSTFKKPRIPLEQSDVAQLGIGDLESKKDQERLVKFLEILSKKVNEYTNQETICRAYKELFQMPWQIGKSHFMNVVERIQEIEEIDLETRAKIMFVTGTRLGLDFIKALRKQATVSLNLTDRIIYYRSNKVRGKTFGKKPPDCSGCHANSDAPAGSRRRRSYAVPVYEPIAKPKKRMGRPPNKPVVKRANEPKIRRVQKRANLGEIYPRSSTSTKPAETAEDPEIITISDNEKGIKCETVEQWSDYLSAGGYGDPYHYGNSSLPTPNYDSTVPMEFQESMLSANQFLRHFSPMIRLLDNPELKELEETVKEKRAQTSGADDKKIPIQVMITNMTVNIPLMAKYVESASSPPENGQDLQIFVDYFSDFLGLLTLKNPEFQEIRDLFQRTFPETDDFQSKQIPQNILKIAFDMMFFELGR